MQDKVFLDPETSQSQVELEGLLAEIPTWDNHVLLHMNSRFRDSKLFKVLHQPDADLTPRAKILLEATLTEMNKRELSPLPSF